jgi:AcrR family transcriptional regulator
MARRTGRRPGTSTAKADILTAARELFATDGYDRTTVRAIAQRAGVDVALVSYYYDNKRGLFASAMSIPVDPGEVIERAVNGPREGAGERLISAFLRLWEEEPTAAAAQTLIRSVAVDPAAAKAFGEFASNEMMPILARSMGVSTDTGRVVASTVLGLAFLRYVVGAPMITGQSIDQLVAVYGPAIQHLVDADPGHPDAARG